MRPVPTFVVLAAMAAFADPGFAQSALTPVEFAQKAAAANIFEIEESKLALAQAANPKIKAFAQKMIADHTLAQQKLEAAAAGSGAQLTTTPDEPGQAVLTALRSKTGVDFDKGYVIDQIKAHEATLTLLSQYKNTGNFPKLKVWAAKTQPTIAQHLQAVSALADLSR